MDTILCNFKLSVKKRVDMLIEGCLIPYDNSFVLK